MKKSLLPAICSLLVLVPVLYSIYYQLTTLKSQQPEWTESPADGIEIGRSPEQLRVDLQEIGSEKHMVGG